VTELLIEVESTSESIKSCYPIMTRINLKRKAMYSEPYKNQFLLLLKILPFLKDQNQFLIKGGTANQKTIAEYEDYSSFFKKQ